MQPLCLNKQTATAQYACLMPVEFDSCLGNHRKSKHASMNDSHRCNRGLAAWDIFIHHPSAYAVPRAGCRLLCTQKAVSKCFVVVQHAFAACCKPRSSKDTQYTAQWLSKFAKHIRQLEIEVSMVIPSETPALAGLTKEEKISAIYTSLYREVSLT